MAFEIVKEYASELLTATLAAISGYWLIAKSWASLSTRITILELASRTLTDKLDDLSKNITEHRKEQQDILQTIDSKITDIYKNMNRR